MWLRCIVQKAVVRNRSTSPFDIPQKTETRTMSRIGDEQRNQVFTDVENYIKQASDMLQREAARLRQEQQDFAKSSKQ